MTVLHFDCFSGISGDMTLGALIDAGADLDRIRDRLASFGLPITVETERVKRNGLAAVKVEVIAPDQDDYRFLPDIEAIFAKSTMSPAERERSLRIFRKLAEAEAHVHGMPIEKVHFHEVGALDSIADIAGSAVALTDLGIERATCRSVPPGSGAVKCAHGVMPIPTPATAVLLRGMPLAVAPVTGELVTPTGAAILAAEVGEFTEQPRMTIDRIGCGAGKRDPWELANILRVFIGTAEPTGGAHRDSIVVLETNLDDAPAEWIGYAIERLFEAGALDVFTVPIQMKKNRPGAMLTVLVRADQADRCETIMLRETGSFGVRRTIATRRIRDRVPVVVSTSFGTIRGKRGSGLSGEGTMGGHGASGEHAETGGHGGDAVMTPEYDDCARIARERGVPIRDVYLAFAIGASQMTAPGRPS